MADGATIKERPRALTETVRAKLVEAVGKGATIELACQYARVSRGSFFQWQKDAREGLADQAVLDLLDDMEEAEGKLSAELLDIIKAAAPKDWKAGAWLLERWKPDGYSRRTVVAVTKDSDPDEFAKALRDTMLGMDFYTKRAGRVKAMEVPQVNGNGHSNGAA